MDRQEGRGQAQESLDLWALCRAAWGEDGAAARASWQELGRRAAREGWARRFLWDVAEGRLRLPPDWAVPGLRQLALRDPEPVLDLLREGGESGRGAAAVALGACREAFLDRLNDLARWG